MDKIISELDTHVLKAAIEVGYSHFAGKIRNWYKELTGKPLSLEDVYGSLDRLVNLGFLEKLDSDYFLPGKPMNDVVVTQKGINYFRS